MSQLFYSPVSINALQVPSTQTDFPVLVSQTDNRFKTIGNGGHVNNSSGFDIRPYGSATLSPVLTYELERYNSSTGEVIMWVKVGNLSSSTTPIYLGYGDTTLTTDGSNKSTWSNGFVSVYHLKNGTVIDFSDATGSHDGSSSTGVTAVSGQIDGAAGFAAASHQQMDTSSYVYPTALTYSAWVNATTLGTDYNPVLTRGAAGTDRSSIYIKSNGKLYCVVLATTSKSYDGTGSHTLSTGTWYYITMTYDITNGLIGYVNAASDNTVAANGLLATTANATTIGGQPTFRWFDGSIDEARISSVARSADWITTEYNNQSAPGTFESLGSEVAATKTGLYRS